MEQAPTEITLAIAEAASDALGTPIETLPPLSESVDLDGVTAVVTDDPSRDVTMTFLYAGLRVIVHSGFIVYARPVEDEMPITE